MTNLRLFFSLVISLCCSLFVYAQDLQKIGSQKPFTWQGNIGASLSVYSSTEPVYTQPPYAWNLYGNFTGNVYGVSLPVSFLVNQYGKSYTSPFTQFGISPTYKWAKLHLGYRNIPFSPLTFEGQSFRGAGIELTPGLLRFAAFIGRLNKAVNEDTTSGRLSMPQFSRKGHGVKLGIGNAANYFDLIYFKASDDSSSTRVITKLGPVRPQENAVLGSSFRITILKKLILSSDLALSGLTQDQSFEKDSSSGLGLFDQLLKTNATTVLAWAGQLNLALNLKGVQTTLGYRRVQPDFKSLGTPYMLNDVESISFNNNLVLSKGKLNISTVLGRQHNNLNKNLSSQLNTSTGNININLVPNTKFTVNLNASGYQLNQRDGVLKLNDSFRLRQNLLQVSLSPVYILPSTRNRSSLSANFTAGRLEDKNPATRSFNSNRNLSGSVTASKYFTERSMNLSLTLMHNRFKQGENLYTSSGFTAGFGLQALKSKKLGLQGSLGYLFNNYETAKAGGNVIFSFSANYQTGKHALNLFTNYLITTPGNLVPAPDKAPYAVSSRNFAGGISYNYSF